MSQPPPIPSDVPVASNPTGKVIPGTEGMSVAEVEQEVAEGGRFVLFSYCVSILILTFRRSSSVRFLRRGVDGTGAAVGYSLLSSVVGWWGFPWGPIYTIGALISNFRGGKDVTVQVLEALTGPGRAAEVMATRRKPAAAGTGMMVFRSLMVAAPFALVTPIVLGMLNAEKQDASRKSEPGYAAYDEANKSISADVNSGNTSEARRLGDQISSSMQRMLEFAAQGEKGKSLNTRCPVRCDMNGETCIVLMKVPDLRKYDKESKDALADALWKISQSCLEESGVGKSGLKLVTGLRGVALYEAVMMGEYGATGGSEPRQKLEHGEGVDQLIQAFQKES
ncbi:hypothetical protein [Phragmitibacter flavus]|uniref:hypothetical protein n=1 Tax=Phragmitibacter flavus TaxID=2576071 RepID=UPI001980501D|nr:hypothetical protein [Phragmitibacter flavus]